MRHALVRLALLLVWLMPMLASAQIGLSPRILVVDLDEQPRGHSFRLLNMSERDVKVEVTLTNWTMDEGNQPVIIPPEPTSLDQWLIVNPLQFEVPAGQSQTVRLAFRPNQQLPDGEYRAMLYFTQILEPDPERNAPIRSRFRIGAAIYAHVGEERFAAELGEFRVQWPAADDRGGAAQLLIDIDNRGNRHVRMLGQWALWRAGAFPGTAETTVNPSWNLPDAEFPEGLLAAGPLATTPVLPDTHRTVATELDLPDELPDGALLDINGMLGSVAIDRTIALNRDASAP